MATIRPLTEADAVAYRDLRLRLLRDTPHAYGTTYEEAVARPVEHSAARLRAQQDQEYGITLGAFADEGATLVGMATLLRGEGAKLRHKADVYAVGVAPELRGQGIARALMDDLLAHARRMDGLEQLYLTVVLPNEAARRLYRACGFVAFGIDERGLKLGDQYWDELQLVLFL